MSCTSSKIKGFLSQAWVIVLLAIAVNILFGLLCVPLRRAFQLQTFNVFFLLLCALPLGNKVRTLCAVLSILSSFVLFVFFGAQGFLYTNYDADLQSSFVIESLANTNVEEATGYLKTISPQVLFWTVLTAVFFLLNVALTVWVRLLKPVSSKFYTGFVIVLCAVSIFGWCKTGWRNKFPVFEINKLVQDIDGLHAKWRGISVVNEQFLASASSLIRSVSEQPQTIVLVIGESMTRESMSLYGYARNTTPNLSQEYKEDKRFLKAGEAYSVKASTVAAFHTMLGFEPDKLQKQNIMAFFKKAGYEITWISNQDDFSIRAEYESFADHKINLNRQKGRDAASMDEKVLPELKAALEQPAAKKLIVVHLIGLHPHFSLRYPEGLKPNWEDSGAVEEEMDKEDRSLHTRMLKDSYDLAMLYQDKILFDSLQMTKNIKQQGTTSWLYLSDHGCETGERNSKVGHSPTTLGGYTIPFLYWSSKQGGTPQQESFNDRGFRADWLSYLLLDIAGIQTDFPVANKSWINEGYHWQEPSFITTMKKSDSEYNEKK